MRLIFTTLLLIGILPAVYSQRTCSSYEYTRELIRNGEMNNSPAVTGKGRDTLPNETITIPVVIHLIYNTNQQNISDAQIMSQLTALNNDFNKLNADGALVPEAFKGKATDSKIRFCLARVDPKGRATTGIVRKYTAKEYFLGNDGMKFSAAGGDDAWDNQKYLNIWVCNMFGRSLGYATMPGAPADKDGVVINWDVFGTTGTVRAPFNKGRTATHEVAHWMGLKHIWGDDICGTDDVHDTPPQKSYNFYCPVFPKVSDCSSDGNGDMFMNFMDLTDDACMKMFTHGQKSKMRGVFAQNGFRNSFLNAYQCDSSYATEGPGPVAGELPVEVITPAPGLKIYPNPVADQINLIPENDFQLEGKSCSIFNLQGKEVYSKKIQTQKQSLNVSFLSPGVYIMKIGDGPDKKMFKLIKI